MKLTFGSRSPYLVFSDEKRFYYALGFLVRSIETGACKLVWENNQNQGAWGHECRIQIFERLAKFENLYSGRVSAGVGKILGRINCNQYLEYLTSHHCFSFQSEPDYQSVKATVPTAYQQDFESGYST
ncbi:hypothetical protein BB427_15880 [Pseudoalteromonas sp. BMB]|uniref:hypothetical protein n=1 Tax=Pseudoalteromonas sp. BMB TaxID=1874619 RepID=UPI00083D2282|nr:hypothetical protein [Pseudoalteromonas sp. BMB]ODB36212.1 hypothetical protein BB427_15880 [Pseudoalteromonas sp. BMB]